MTGNEASDDPQIVWIRGPRLRARWGMSNSSFYKNLKEGALPKPFYPFNGSIPYWSMDEVLAFEAKAMNRKAPGGKSG